MAGPDAFVTLLEKGASYAELSRAADSLSAQERAQVIRRLSASHLAKLYEVAKDGAGEVKLSFLVPDDVPRGHSVDWMGQNSLPLFRAFSKRFTRSTKEGALVGYNEGAMRKVVGPGYFLTRPRPGHASELVIDYTQVPDEAPKGWPKVRRNEAGISRFVFSNMHDYLRPVGSNMAIGGAYSAQGEFKGHYFVLARGETLPTGN